MNKRSVFSLALVVSLLGLLSFSVEIQNAHAPYLIIMIMADGYISPPSANITTADNVTYTFTADINASIIVQRSNIVIDGNGWTLNGVDFTIWEGFNVTDVSNVTITNVNIERFASYSIYLESAALCVLSDNTVTGSEGGIGLFSSTGNTVSNNLIAGCSEAIELVSASGNVVSGNNLSDSSTGVYGFNSTDNAISENSIKANTQGIYLGSSSNFNTVTRNNITANTNDGISLWYSSNITVSENQIRNNFNCIRIWMSSGIQIIENDLMENNHGIALGGNSCSLYRNDIQVEYIGIDIFGSYNIISRNNITNCGTGFFFGGNSIHNVVSGNTVTDNTFALYFEQAYNNSIVENYLAGNTYGIYLDWYSYNMRIYHNTFNHNKNPMTFPNPSNPNFLDNGVEGNYRSDYTGVDLNHDGIGDTPHIINANNTDHYPLMGPFHRFNTSLGKSINLISNSTVDGFEYESPGMIRFTVSNTTQNQTHGFCRVTIPYEALSTPFNVTIDGANPTYWNYTVYNNGTHNWIYFEYAHSTKEIMIIPESPSLLVLPLFMTVSLVAALVYGRKRS